MSKKEIICKIDEALEWLYQNKEKKSLQRVAELLQFFQNMAEELVDKDIGGVAHVMNLLKILVENYDHMDMIGMADCLREYAYPLIDTYIAE